MIDLLTGDCREVTRTLPDASVDLVIADPPYGDTACDWDKQVDGWLDDLPRVLKPTGSLWCFGSMRFFIDRGADFAGWNYAQEVVWEKHNGSNSFSDRFRRVHEIIVQFYPKGRQWAEVYKKPLYSDDATARVVRRKQKAQHWSKIKGSHYASIDGGPRLLRSVLYHRSEHGLAEHETQKPAGLLLPVIEYSCPEGGVVLDPMAGSGTTGIAARALNRSAILIELRQAAVDVARSRIARDAPLLYQGEADIAMPIRPENKMRYPVDWPEIRERIRQRAADKCEQCGVPNGALIYRDDSSDWHPCAPDDAKTLQPMLSVSAVERMGFKAVRIVCTTAHLDHIPEHVDDSNLKFLCQKDHLAYDAEHHAQTAYATRREGKAVADLFQEERSS